MTEDFTHNDEYTMKCSESKPCYCYGRICLTGGRNCSEGNVFISGRPVCGANIGWDTAFAATIVCKDLGFDSGVKTPSVLKRLVSFFFRNISYRKLKNSNSTCLVYDKIYSSDSKK